MVVPNIETALNWQLTEESEFWKVHFEDEQLDAYNSYFSVLILILTIISYKLYSLNLSIKIILFVTGKVR